MSRRQKRARRPAHPKPRCKVCDSTTGPWTEEDGYPKWLRKRIHEWLRALPAGALDPGWEQGRRVLLKPVCQRCQRRLNDLFEVPAHELLKTMMDGSIVPLAPRQQGIVAGWAVKTALVLVLERTVEPYAAQLLRGYLGHMLKDGTPPANATARVAYLSDGLERSREGFLPPGWPDALDTRQGFVSVISVPGFICETIIGPAAVVRSFIDVTKEDDRFALIWPPQIAETRWPPPIPLSLFGSEALREEWSHSEWYGNFPAVTVTEHRVVESHAPSHDTPGSARTKRHVVPAYVCFDADARPPVLTRLRCRSARLSPTRPTMCPSPPRRPFPYAPYAPKAGHPAARLRCAPPHGTQLHLKSASFAILLSRCSRSGRSRWVSTAITSSRWPRARRLLHRPRRGPRRVGGRRRAGPRPPMPYRRRAVRRADRGPRPTRPRDTAALLRA